jgi:tetratricopeptide (TPR) repeat protein/outer membrane protein assembly factor BamB
MKDLLKLLESLERKRPVGTLSLGRRGRSCELFLEGDQVYYAGREYSGRVDIEGLLRMDLIGTRISPSVLEAAMSATNLVQKPIPETLLERNIISSEERAALIGSHLGEEIYAHAFRQRESFSFRQDQVPEHLLGGERGRVSVSLPSLIALVKGRAEQAEVVASLVPSHKEVFVLTEKGMARRSSPEADFGTKRLFDLIDGFRSLGEVIRDTVFFEFYILSRIADALQAGYLRKTLSPEIREVSITHLDREGAARYLPAFKAAVKYSVDEIGARERLAVLYERLDDPEEAVIQYNFMGDALYRMKKVPKALQAFQKALELRPRDPFISDKVVKIYQEAAEMALKENKRDVALTLLGAAHKTRPDAVEVSEKLLSLHVEDRDVQAVAEICDAAVARSLSERDLAPALRILGTAVEKFPQESLFRKKLVNVYLDFGMNEEAVAELEELARRELKLGATTRAQEILEKILRIDPSRDDLRRQLKGSTRRPRTRHVFNLRISFLKVALVLGLLLAGYQYWSYLDLQPFREQAVAYSNSGPARAAGIQRTAREEQLVALALGADRFQERFPVSAFIFEARRLAKGYRDEAARMARDRERLKEEIFSEGNEEAEKGRQEAAVRAWKRLLAVPSGDPWRVRAEDAIQKTEAYERRAEDLRQRADAAIAAADWPTAYRMARRVLDDHPLSRAAASVEVPVVVRTVPEGVVLKVGTAVLGPSPQVVRVRPGKPAEVEAASEGFLDLQETVPQDQGPDCTLLLSRRPLWSGSLSAPLKFAPVLGKSLVLFVLENGALVACGRDDGALRWTHGGGTVVSPVAPPLEAEGHIYLPLNDGQVLRFSQSGELKTRIKPSGLIATPLVVSGNLLVFGSSNRTLVGWDPAANELAWSLPVKSVPVRLSLAAPGQILTLFEKGRLVLTECPAGRVVWETSIGEEIVFGPLETGSVAVLGTADHRLVTLELRSGNVLSRRVLPTLNRAVVLAGQKRLVLIEETAPGPQSIVELDLQSGQETARAALGWPASGLLDLGPAAGAALTGGGFLYLHPGSYGVSWAHGRGSTHIRFSAGDERLMVLANEKGDLAAFAAEKP